MLGETKTHRHLEKPKNISAKSCPACNDDPLAFLADFQSLKQSTILQQNSFKVFGRKTCSFIME